MSFLFFFNIYFVTLRYHHSTSVCVGYENELSVLLIKHDPTHTLVLLRQHHTLCQVVNPICMCVRVLGAIIVWCSAVLMEKNAVSSRVALALFHRPLHLEN